MSTSEADMKPSYAAPEIKAARLAADAQVVQRTGRGVFYSAIGQALLFACSMGGSVFLARLLSPRDFGVYAICIFVVQKLSMLSDIGLNAKIIHDHRAPTLREQRSVFTLNLCLAAALYAALFCCVPWLGRVFRLDADAARLIRVLALVIPFSPFRLIPVAMLSRRLQYDRLALEELASGIVFQLAAIFFAFHRFAYWSFGLAGLATIPVRLLVLYGFAGWSIGFAWDGPYLKRSARFGGQFQITWFLTVMRENLTTFIGGPMFGPTAVGLLNWAMRLASVCSQELANICGRVSFPSLSRMRAEPALFDAALCKTLRYLNLVGILFLSITAAFAPQIVHLVFTDKWLPAIPLFYAYALRMVALSFTAVFDVGLKAQGQPGTSMKVALVWTAIELPTTIAAALLWGYLGIAVAAVPAACLAAVSYWRQMSRYTHIPLWNTTAVPLACGVGTYVAIRLLKLHHVSSILTLAAAATLGVLVFVALALALEGSDFIRGLKDDLAGLFTGVLGPKSKLGSGQPTAYDGAV